MKQLAVTGVIFLLYITSSLAQINYSGSDFNCPPLSSGNGTPNSVHRLRPSDIQVIGGMGSTLTAGFGILSPFGAPDYVEYRGLAWSAGMYVCVELSVLKEF